MSTTVDAAAGPVIRSLSLGVHGMFGLLLAIGTIRGVQDTENPAWMLAGCLLLGAWYALGITLQSRRTGVSAPLWFAVLFLGWVGLVAASSELSWVAFALFFLALHLLPRAAGLVAVAAGTAVVVLAQLSKPGVATVPSIIGPCMGALVAVGISWAYRQVRSESEQRRALNAELLAAQGDLIATHDALAGAQRESGVLAERARLARDVHDTLAQGFSSIVLLSRAGLAGADDPERLRDVLQRIEESAVTGLQDARSVVHALTPTELERAPLTAALQRLIDRQDDGATVVELQVEGDLTTLSTATEVTLLRIAQGALANVRQHARAHQASIVLRQTPAATLLTVRDDGIGFDIDDRPAPSQAGGYGLDAMRERVRQSGGRLRVDSRPGTGTTVLVELPLTQETSP